MRAAPAPRLALLTAAAALPALVPTGLWLSGALALLVLLVALVDLARSRRLIELTRRVDPVLSLGAENRVQLELRSPGSPLDVELKEDLPLYLELAGAWPRVQLGGTDWQHTGYQLRPSRRGRYALSTIRARYRSPLGLWRRQEAWSLPEQIRVYPNLAAARQWELAIRKGRHLEGLKRSRVRGTGTEFESLREYQAGDPFRAIHWPAAARLGKLVTMQYQVERSRPIMLVMDGGRMMTPRIRGLTRLDHALNAALLLATVAAERGDQVGLMLFGGEVRAFVPPGKGRGQVLGMLESVYAAEPEQVEPDYGRMIGWLRAKHKKRSLVVFFTDLVDPDVSRGLIAHLSALAAHQAVLLVCLSDPELLRLSRLMPEGSQELYQKATALEVLAHRADTKARLQAAGVTVVDVPPDEFSPAVVNHYLLLREQGRV